MRSQQFVDTRTNEIVTQVPLSDIEFFQEITEAQADEIAHRVEVIHIGADAGPAETPAEPETQEQAQPEPLQAGQRVRVSSGTPRPPEHHTRKVREWEYRNYEGTFDGYEAGNYFAQPMCRVKKDNKWEGCISITSIERVSQVTAVAI